MKLHTLFSVCLCILAATFASGAAAQERQSEYRLGAGDAIRVVVFQNPDLTTETRVTENGSITFPLIGTLKVGGLTIPAAEQAIAKSLKDGVFVQHPQVNIVLLANRGTQVSVFGQVNRPGRFPLETTNTRVSEMIAIAGGITTNGANVAILTGARDGKPMRREIDIANLFLDEHPQNDVLVEGGDVIYVPQVNMALLANRGNQVYVLGQVNHPGRFPLETLNVRLAEMIAIAGGVAPTGADVAVLTGVRDGKRIRKEVDIAGLFLDHKIVDDIVLSNGDVIYVHRAPVFYVYGEVQHPGSYRVERGMSLRQALAQGGGPTLRGNEYRLRLHRRGADAVTELTPNLNDPVQPDDVLYVREGLF